MKNTRSKQRSHRNSQKGGLVEDYVRLFDGAFDNQWILTGSEAVRLLAEHFGIAHTLQPGDLDVVYVSPTPFRSRFVGNFARVQDEPMRSMTFEDAGRSFDLLVEQRSPQKYVFVPYMGVQYRVLHPARLLREYQSDLDVRGNKQAADLQKIAILQQVLTHEFPEMRMSPVQEREFTPMRRMGALSFDGGRTRKSRKTRKQRGGLGRIPSSAIVDIQADPYSARMLVDADTAANILAARE
jgi:hypothetical protein